MNSFTKFFHELFNPHCSHCMEALRESKVCDTCEYLKAENARLNRENENLLDRLLNKPPKTQVNIEQPKMEFKPLNVGLTQSWAVKRQLLENEDRATALELAKNKKSTEQLENVVLKDASK